MEPARDAPWAEHEKVYLLAEIIKTSLPSHVLFNILRDSNIQPKWNDIALPHGRSLRSSQAAYNDMSNTFAATDYRQRPQLPAPIVYPGPDLPKKRPHQPEATTPMGRLIQPRPPHSYPGEFVSGPAYALSPVEPSNKKKRGRPTKAEAQARADAAAARGEVYPPPRKGRASVTSVDPQPGEVQRPPAATPPGSAPAIHMGAMTPQQTQPERGSESSSGKRKRSKPTPLELEKTQREPSETESPLAISASGDPSRSSQAYSSFTPISAPPISADLRDRDRDTRMEGIEESQPRTTTPHSFKDTVGI